MSGPSQQTTVPTAAALLPGTDYAWRVQTTLDSGVTEWSQPLSFATAPTAESWSAAKWIGGHNQLRADIALPADTPITRARAYVTGVGAFYLYINGQQVGDHILDPPQTVYPKRMSYMTFDVSKLIHPGANAIGAELGNYKWGYVVPRVLLALLANPHQHPLAPPPRQPCLEKAIPAVFEK